MAQSVDRRKPGKPAWSSGHRSRSNDEDSVGGLHQGQQSIRTASTGRTHDCKRPVCCTPKDLLPGGGHPHMIGRREFVTLLGGAAVAWPMAARAQQPERTRRIVIFLNAAADDPRYQPWVGAFLQALALLGWTIGRNVRIDTRWSGANAAETRRHAAELV